MRSVRLSRSFGILWLMFLVAVHCPGQQPTRERQRQSALALEQQGKFSDAEAAWKSILARRPNDAEAYAHLGLLEARQEHYKEAIPYYRKALAITPNMPNLELDLGLSLFKSGDLRGAIQTFEPVLKKEPASAPESARLATLIGLAHYGLGEYAAAVPYLKRAAAADPADLPLRMTLAQSCMSSKQYQCVLHVYREILAINPNSAEADVLAGEAYDELKNEAGALEQFQAAVKADPKLPNVHFGYGYLLWKAQKLDAASEQFRAELANNPDNALALTYLADSEIKLNHPKNAALYLEHAIRIQPSIALAHLDLGIVYQGEGKKDDALRELKVAEKIDPDDSEIHWQMGRLYQSMGRRAEAKAEFTKTRNLQNATQQSLREKMHQAETKPAGQNSGAEGK
jgi:tetratricopeptide (TPR) repeat protein